MELLYYTVYCIWPSLWYNTCIYVLDIYSTGRSLDRLVMWFPKENSSRRIPVTVHVHNTFSIYHIFNVVFLYLIETDPSGRELSPLWVFLLPRKWGWKWYWRMKVKRGERVIVTPAFVLFHKFPIWLTFTPIFFIEISFVLPPHTILLWNFGLFFIL